jgi:uncharacterized protein (TIGR03083 family)
MSEHPSKATLLQRLRDERADLDALVASVPRERMTEPGATGDWSLKDVLAHIAEGERWTAGEIRKAGRGESPSREELEEMRQQGLFDNDTRNQIIWKQHRDDTLDDVLAEASAAYRDLVSALEEASEETLNAPAWWTRGQPLLDVLPPQCYAHYHEHEPLVRTWLERSA